MRGKRLSRYALAVFAATVTPVLAVDPATHALTGVTQPTTLVKPTTNAQLWNLKNADIRAVIQTISVLTGKNFVIDPRVQGNITLVSQKPMTPDEMYQVFLSMLQLLQFSAIPSVGGVIKIVPAAEGNALSHQVATNKSPGQGDEIVVRVVPIRRVSATELVPVLRPLMTQSGSVTAYLPSNSLILAGTASNISRLMQVINQMDNENVNQVAVVPLHYASAKKVVEMVQALQGRNSGNTTATLVADEETNSVLVSANAANQAMTRQLISQLDRQGAGGEDTRVVMLNYLTAKNVAPILAKIAEGMSNSGTTSGVKNGDNASDTTGTGVSNNVSIQAEDNNNAIVMHAPKSMLDSLMTVIGRLDVRPQEVLVEAIIVKVDESLLDKLGIEWGSPDRFLADTNSAAATGNAMASIVAAGQIAAKVGSHGIGLLPNGSMIALLHLLKQDGSTDVLSTPSVMVLNNDKATIDDGQNLGVANRSYQGTTPVETANMTPEITAPYNTIERQDVTLSLEVTPHISPDQMIRLELLQKDDTVASDKDPRNDNPTFNTSKIKTSVLVKSGDVLVLGGLISNNQQKIQQKIPVLGSLPVVGRLFSYESTQLQKTSLMVFIRPIIMSDKTSKEQTVGRYRYLRQQQIELETERMSDITKMPMLPKDNHAPQPTLPQPVSTVDLPMPAMTEKPHH